MEAFPEQPDDCGVSAKSPVYLLFFTFLFSGSAFSPRSVEIMYAECLRFHVDPWEIVTFGRKVVIREDFSVFE